jgi:hypothetical protein
MPSCDVEEVLGLTPVQLVCLLKLKKLIPGAAKKKTQKAVSWLFFIFHLITCEAPPDKIDPLSKNYILNLDPRFIRRGS